MATRRVRRIKRTGSKKRHSHHGRKTTRHHKRHTKRQMAGMFKAMAKSLASTKLNPRNGPFYGGIEVFKADVGGELRYYIGNRPIDAYTESADPADRAYGQLIRSNLTGLIVTPDTGKTFNGILYLDQANFDKFSAKPFTSAVSADAATAADEPNRGVILENVPGSGKMILHFGPTSYDLIPDRALKIRIPSPPSGDSPVKELIFVGNASGITVTFVMKKTQTTYCALWTYDRRTQYTNTDQIDYAVPSITKPLVLKSERRNDITGQIIPMIDQLADASNGCDLAAAQAYYVSDAHHVDETIKQQILSLFPRTSLSAQMSDLRVGDD